MQIINYQPKYLSEITNLWYQYYSQKGFFVLPNGNYHPIVTKQDFVDNLEYELNISENTIKPLKNDSDFIWYQHKVNLFLSKNILLTIENDKISAVTIASTDNKSIKITCAFGNPNHLMYLLGKNEKEKSFICPDEKLTSNLKSTGWNLRSSLYYMSRNLFYSKPTHYSNIKVLDQELLPKFKKFIATNLPDTKGQQVFLENKIPLNTMLVALHNDQIAGSLGPNFVFHNSKHNYGKLGHYFVTPQFRGLKYGQKLLSTLLHQFDHQKIDFSSFKVSIDNLPALKVYEKLGYKKIVCLNNLVC
jgi:predicted acetyltransferase